MSAKKAGKENKIRNAMDAERYAEKYLQTIYKGVKSVAMDKVWYQTGAQRDIWLVEGLVRFNGEKCPFKLQLDPVKGELMGYTHLVLPHE